MVNRQGRIDGKEGLANRALHQLGVSFGADHQVIPEVHFLSFRDVCLHARGLSKPVLADIPDDAHDRPPGLGVVAPPKLNVFADWVFVGEHRARQRFTAECHSGLAGAASVLEQAPALQGNSHHRKTIG